MAVAKLVSTRSSSRGLAGVRGVNKQIDLGVYLFLTRVCEVTEPSDTRNWSMPSGLFTSFIWLRPWHGMNDEYWIGFCAKHPCDQRPEGWVNFSPLPRNRGASRIRTLLCAPVWVPRPSLKGVINNCQNSRKINRLYLSTKYQASMRNKAIRVWVNFSPLTRNRGASRIRTSTLRAPVRAPRPHWWYLCGWVRAWFGLAWGVRVLTSMLTSGSTCFLQGSA